MQEGLAVVLRAEVYRSVTDSDSVSTGEASITLKCWVSWEARAPGVRATADMCLEPLLTYKEKFQTSAE